MSRSLLIVFGYHAQTFILMIESIKNSRFHLPDNLNFASWNPQDNQKFRGCFRKT